MNIPRTRAHSTPSNCIVAAKDDHYLAERGSLWVGMVCATTNNKTYESYMGSCALENALFGSNRDDDGWVAPYGSNLSLLWTKWDV